MMNWVMYLFCSGAVFFLGVALILMGVALFLSTSRKWLGNLATHCATVGLILIIFSASPLPYWFYFLGGGATALWLTAERFKPHRFPRCRYVLRGLVGVIWLTAAGVEFPYHLSPSVTAAGRPKLYMIGDSVAAGMGSRGEETWPRLLARTRSIEVADFSRVGATAASALQQAEGLPPAGGMVLLEIGGNDLLGSTTATQFASDLDRLLARVCAAGRSVLMFELPLPPFRNEYGRIQRRLAAKYGVSLIPKRIFIAVLTANGATLDSIHLTREGHQQMAEAVWRLVAPVYTNQEH